MRVRLIIPRWPVDSFWDSTGFKFSWLATTLLAALTPPQHEVQIDDESLAPLDFGVPADLVGITAMTPLAPRAYEIGDEYRRRGVPVVLGGVHATWMPEEAAAHADAVVVGEADELWAGIVKDAEHGQLRPLYRQETFSDLARLPLPRLELLDDKGYFFENLVQTTRGCPHDCEFCSVTAMYGGAYRTRPVAEVRRELEALRRHQAFVFFADDNLLGDLRHARKLLEMLTDFNFRWVSQGTITMARDPELLRLMARSGCHGMFIGFESLEERNLSLMGKPTNRVERYEEYIARLHDQGIGVYGSFIFGYEHDDERVFDGFLKFAHRNALDGALMSLLTPFPGTALRQRLLEQGRVLTNDWALYDMATCVFQPAGMSPEALQEGFWYVNRHFYSLLSASRRIFNPLRWGRRLMIFGPMNIGHWRSTRRAYRTFRRAHRAGKPA